jgi:Domain of unknown function (DUF4926)
MDIFKLLDVVTLLQAMPEYGLRKGQVGAIVEVWADGEYEVEFADLQGRTIALVSLSSDFLMLLHYEPMAIAA